MSSVSVMRNYLVTGAINRHPQLIRFARCASGEPAVGFQLDHGGIFPEWPSLGKACDCLGNALSVDGVQTPTHMPHTPSDTRGGGANTLFVWIFDEKEKRVNRRETGSCCIGRTRLGVERGRRVRSRDGIQRIAACLTKVILPVSSGCRHDEYRPVRVVHLLRPGRLRLLVPGPGDRAEPAGRNAGPTVGGHVVLRVAARR